MTTGDAVDGLLGLRTASRVTDMCSHHVLTLTCTLHIGKNVQEEQMFKKKKMRPGVMERGPNSKFKEKSQRQTVFGVIPHLIPTNDGKCWFVCRVAVVFFGEWN